VSRLGIDLTQAEYEAHLERMREAEARMRDAERDASLDRWAGIVDACETSTDLRYSVADHTRGGATTRGTFGYAPNGRAYQSRTEAAYAAVLDVRQRVGEIREWRYEEVTLYIGHGVRYTADFLVITHSQTNPYELHEVKAKGYWLPNAKTKFRAAAMRHPWYIFRGVTRVKGTFVQREVHNA
jgi:hypothetical protein